MGGWLSRLLSGRLGGVRDGLSSRVLDRCSSGMLDGCLSRVMGAWLYGAPFRTVRGWIVEGIGFLNAGRTVHDCIEMKLWMKEFQTR